MKTLKNAILHAVTVDPSFVWKHVCRRGAWRRGLVWTW